MNIGAKHGTHLCQLCFCEQVTCLAFLSLRFITCQAVIRGSTSKFSGKKLPIQVQLHGGCSVNKRWEKEKAPNSGKVEFSPKCAEETYGANQFDLSAAGRKVS